MIFLRKYNCLIKSYLVAIITLLVSINSFSQVAANFGLASNYFDDGGAAKTAVENRRVGDAVFGLIEDFTGQYVTYKKATRKEDGTLIKDTDIVKGKGIYRKKGSEFFKLNFDGPVNIRWFGAVADGKTDNSESIRQALAASSFIKIPAGNFGIASSVHINNTVQIVGDGMLQSQITCLNKNISAFTIGSNTALEALSMINISNLTIANGKYGIIAVRDNGKRLSIERSDLNRVSFVDQTDAGIYLKGEQLMFLVNTLQQNVFRYCGTGILLDNVFSANLNHIQLNRFEGTVGGISISTSNNELSQLTIQKNRFEAIISKHNIASPISILGGNQNVSISDNYFEDVPDPVINIDALNGLSIAPSITNNQFSANIKGPVMIKLASQVKSPYIASNVFKPGQPGTKLDFSSYVSDPNLIGNYGNLSFVSYPISYENLMKKEANSSSAVNYFKKTVSHKGDFSFDIKLPSSGVFEVSVAVADDGDFSLGGVASFKVAWIKADAPLVFVKEAHSKNNPNTVSIELSNPTTGGIITATIRKADKKQRIASCYFSIDPVLDIDYSNTKSN